MRNWTVTIRPMGQKISVPEGTILQQVLRESGTVLDAPCGGRGICGKCAIQVDGHARLACRTAVDHNMEVRIPQRGDHKILTDEWSRWIDPDGRDRYVLAIDIGTTTLAAYLLDGISGDLLAQDSALNPQTQFGADVISRIQYVIDTQSTALRDCLISALADLTDHTAEQADISPSEITMAAIAGNTAMHHLLLGIDPRPMTVPPYMPGVQAALELPARGLLPISAEGTVRVLPNIAGFVGADTVACMVAADFGKLCKPALLIDIGTNGEIVLGTENGRIACSAAAGPAFEGAKISCGMRGSTGAIDHVFLKDGVICWHTIGDGTPRGLCGSGLLDLVAVLLEAGIIDRTGRLTCGKAYRLGESGIELTQRDIREVQLAKGAIRAGIELLLQQMELDVEQIDRVYLAGAFGNYMTPASVCTIGMIPARLLDRIFKIGNAAGAGAKRCALCAKEYLYSKTLAAQTNFLELGTCLEFQERFVAAMQLGEGAGN